MTRSMLCWQDSKAAWCLDEDLCSCSELTWQLPLPVGEPIALKPMSNLTWFPAALHDPISTVLIGLERCMVPG